MLQQTIPDSIGVVCLSGYGIEPAFNLEGSHNNHYTTRLVGLVGPNPRSLLPAGALANCATARYARHANCNFVV